MQNAQNNGNIMQGFSNVQNPNGVMQGTVEETPNDNTMVMPGQVNSGINNYTMSVETPQQVERINFMFKNFDWKIIIFVWQI